MSKKLQEFSTNLIIAWLFSPLGIAAIGTIGGLAITILTFFTAQLNSYAPLSYGLAMICGIILALIILYLLASIYIAVQGNFKTKKPTFLEFRVEQRRVTIINKSNIYKEPSVGLSDFHQYDSPAPAEVGNRKQRRAMAVSGETSRQVIGKNLTLNLRVMFDKPIDPTTFHTRIEPLEGTCPTRDESVMDERCCDMILSNLQDNSSFRIRFN